MKEIALLGKPLSEYDSKPWLKEKIERREISPHNLKVYRNRLNEDFAKNIRDIFVWDGNGLNATAYIIERVRIIRERGLLTDEEWERAVPIIERGLLANKAYVDMMAEISVILDRYCDEYTDENLRYAFSQRVGLECWQGILCNSKADRRHIQYS